MADQGFQLLAIAIYFALMLAIGYYAYRNTRSVGGYMLAERGLSPAVAALSANASDMSGWLLLGLPGAIYSKGLIEAWIAIGLTIGAWCNWKFVAPRLRAYTQIAGDALTIPSFLDQRLRDRSRLLRVTAALIILVFFTFYVSSGMVAAGKFFVTAFGWSYLDGMLVVAAITLLYTLFGGFLGATLTDVAQGLLMLAALIAVPLVVLLRMDDPGQVAAGIEAARPGALDFFAGLQEQGALPWIVAVISTSAWGLGYFGQPHIIVRFMALRSAHEASVARRVSFAWMLLSMAGAVIAALLGIAYFAGSPERPLQDPEMVFLLLSQLFFHPLVSGCVLAAVLAAIMSTMSSQLVVCSSALVEDLYALAGRPMAPRRQLVLGRLGVLVVALVAVLFALNQDATILALVAFAWAGFGAAFGPTVLLCLYWRRLTARGAIAGMLAGAVTVFVWGMNPALSSLMYEIVPGFALNLLVAVAASRFGRNADASIEDEFSTMEQAVRRH